MELNPEIDLAIETEDLTAEFKRISLTLFRYYQQKAHAERELDIAKANLKETKAIVYKLLKSDTSSKITERHLEAEIDTHESVQAATKIVIDAQHAATTWYGAVDSLKAKKDALIQLGSDRRKDIA